MPERSFAAVCRPNRHPFSHSHHKRIEIQTRCWIVCSRYPSDIRTSFIVAFFNTNIDIKRDHGIRGRPNDITVLLRCSLPFPCAQQACVCVLCSSSPILLLRHGYDGCSQSKRSSPPTWVTNCAQSRCIRRITRRRLITPCSVQISSPNIPHRGFGTCDCIFNQCSQSFANGHEYTHIFGVY